jgi:hypothetical protein
MAVCASSALTAPFFMPEIKTFHDHNRQHTTTATKRQYNALCTILTIQHMYNNIKPYHNESKRTYACKCTPKTKASSVL